MINVFQPSLGNEEIEAVRKVIESNWLGKGKKVEEFENKFAEYLGVDTSLVNTMTCCSEGLFSSMKILEIDERHEVILPTISFVGAANAVCNNKSKIVFCDVDKETLNVTAKEIEKKITSNTKALILIHYGGTPCEMKEILDMADFYGIKIIEDSACSIASRYQGQACGTMGDVGIWSFDAMKILVCGDGGAIYVKDRERAEYAKKLMYFGLETQSGYSNSIDNKWWEFEISQYGHRSIMNDITASMAIVQLEKLDKFIDKRKKISEIYNEGLSSIEWLKLPKTIQKGNESSYYFYHIQLKNNKRDDLANYLRNKGIYTTFRYYPLHKVSYYGCKDDKLINAEYASEHTLCIPIHQSLSLSEVEYIIDAIHQFGREKGI